VVRHVHRASLTVAITALLTAGTAGAQSPFSFVKWRSIGPVNTSGRIDDIAVARIRGEPDAIYIATASGGLWKSSNNGEQSDSANDRHHVSPCEVSHPYRAPG